MRKKLIFLYVLCLYLVSKTPWRSRLSYYQDLNNVLNEPKSQLNKGANSKIEKLIVISKGSQKPSWLFQIFLWDSQSCCAAWKAKYQTRWEKEKKETDRERDRDRDRGRDRQRRLINNSSGCCPNECNWGLIQWTHKRKHQDSESRTMEKEETEGGDEGVGGQINAW